MASPENPLPVPREIKLDRSHRHLTVSFDEDHSFEFTSEYLRVHSPSAEVRGHGGEGTLQLGKQDVTIADITPVGNYAVRLSFSDGHNTGLFTWKVLFELGRDREANWTKYLTRAAAAGHPRKPD